MKDYLVDFLRKSAIHGIEQSELRGKIPKHIIDSENLAKLINGLLNEKMIEMKELPAIHIDPNRMQFFDRESIDHIKGVLKRKYKTGLVQGVYPLEVLFDQAHHVQEKVLITQFLNIRVHNFIFWKD